MIRCMIDEAEKKEDCVERPLIPGVAVHSSKIHIPNHAATPSDRGKISHRSLSPPGSAMDSRDSSLTLFIITCMVPMMMLDFWIFPRRPSVHAHAIRYPPCLWLGTTHDAFQPGRNRTLTRARERCMDAQILTDMPDPDHSDSAGGESAPFPADFPERIDKSSRCSHREHPEIDLGPREIGGGSWHWDGQAA